MALRIKAGNKLSQEAHVLDFGSQFSLVDGDGDVQVSLGGSISPVYNAVAQYGATGDGTTDDSTAIQNALDACGNAGGGIVYLPKGTYLVGTSLDMTYDDVTLMGCGPGTVIKATTDIRILKGTSCDRIIVRDLKVLGDADAAKTSQRGIEWNSVTNGLIFGVHAVDCGYDGICLLSGDVGCRVEACYVEGSGDDGINIGGQASPPTTDTTVVGCTVKATNHDCIHISDGSLRTTVTGNVLIDSSEYGISLYNAGKVTIVGNTIQNPAIWGIAVVQTGCADVTIANNLIYGGVQGIRVAYQAVRFAITGNVLRNQTDYGIVFSYSPATNCDSLIADNVISGVTNDDGIYITNATSLRIGGNRITTVGRYGIHLDTGSTKVLVEGNQVSNCTSYAIRLSSGNNDVSIRGNRITSAPRGIYCIGPLRFSICDNDIVSCTDYGIVVTAGTLTNDAGLISGNLIYNGISTNAILISNYEGVIVNGNRCTATGGTNDISGGGATDYCLVVNNYCKAAIASMGSNTTSANNITATGN